LPKKAKNHFIFHTLATLATMQLRYLGLLTGDRALRNAAETESVMVRGTLWLVELMVRQELISIEQARAAYQRMQEAGRRLPWGIAEAILSELEKDV
jgi:predicted nucleic acid-binding protein